MGQPKYSFQSGCKFILLNLQSCVVIEQIATVRNMIDNLLILHPCLKGTTTHNRLIALLEQKTDIITIQCESYESGI